MYVALLQPCNNSRMTKTGIILCGGRGRRAGGIDKGWLEFEGRPLIQHVLGRLTPQVDEVIISANRNLSRYRELGCAVVADELNDFQGPLAGIAAALAQASHARAVVVACDLPKLPVDIATRLMPALEAHDVGYAWDGKREQYLVAALHTRLGGSLEAYLAAGHRSVRGWYQQLKTQRVDCSADVEAFLNVNEVATAG